MIAQSVKRLSEDELYMVYRDALQRIGSQVVSGDPVPEYITKQEGILNVVQDELMERRSHGRISV